VNKSIGERFDISKFILFACFKRVIGILNSVSSYLLAKTRRTCNNI